MTAISVIFLGILAETQAGHGYCISEFYKYFEGLGMPDARVNPVERFVFSLLLTRTKPETHADSLRDSPAGKRL